MQAKFIVLIFIVLLFGCNGSSDSEPEDTLSLFKHDVTELAGNEAINCGDYYNDYNDTRDEDAIFESQQCAYDAYTLSYSFYLFYRWDDLHSADYIGYAFNGEVLYEVLYNRDDGYGNGSPHTLLKKCTTVTIQSSGFPLQCNN